MCVSLSHFQGAAQFRGHSLSRLRSFMKTIERNSIDSLIIQIELKIPPDCFLVVIFPQARIEVNQLIDLRLAFSYRYRLLPGVIMGGGFSTFSINYFWFFIVQRALRRRDKNRLKCKVEKVFFIFNSTEK